MIGTDLNPRWRSRQLEYHLNLITDQKVTVAFKSHDVERT